MPESTASHDMSDHTSQNSAPAPRTALNSGPRQDMPPPHPIASATPMPPPWPSVDGAPGAMQPANGVDGADEMDVMSDFPPRRPEDKATRPLFAPEQWVSDPDFWETKTHIALTGRHPVPRPKTVALKPPQRFRPAPRWRSMLILLVVCVMIVATVIGTVELGRLGMQVIAPPHHSATPVPTHTIVVPTATPHHKK
ncbi:MAG TPA: hypothetical protein VKQ30_12340 [Ktedonobacterales bacterium]|nr:hypothetical protein [Ktedonobacterales bacterium]